MENGSVILAYVHQNHFKLQFEVSSSATIMTKEYETFYFRDIGNLSIMSTPNEYCVA